MPEVAALADGPALRPLVASVLGSGCFAVRGILFDKTPEANWNVAWHQDLSIAVRERRDVEGFGPWSEKAGVVHVQPPAAVLERMVTVRLHLDDCDASNGPLLVLPSSHRGGRLTALEIQEWRGRTASVACPIPSGGALLMRLLLLHASSASQSPRHRRVIHLEYAAEALPGGAFVALWGSWATGLNPRALEKQLPPSRAEEGRVGARFIAPSGSALVLILFFARAGRGLHF